MQRDQYPDELVHHWTVLPDEWPLLQPKGKTTKLTFAILLKFFQLHATFPDPARTFHRMPCATSPTNLVSQPSRWRGIRAR